VLSFRLGTLYSAEANSDSLAAFELAAFFLSDASLSDIPIDVDEARDWYIENIVEESSRTDYRAEPQMAEDEMFESFGNSMNALVEERLEELGDHYPFHLTDNGRLVRKDISEISAVGASYVALQFFRGVNAGTLEIDGDTDADIASKRARFERLFRKVFEYIAGYAVAGRRSGASFMTSDCRSSVRLEILLRNLCAKVGVGQVLPYAHWNAEQKAANDGGVDCLVHVGGPAMPGDAHFLLVGATVQKSNIDQKIMSSDAIDFFGRFFTARPAAFQGALVRPMDEDALTKLKCVERNCLLFTYDQIWRGMGKRCGGSYQNNSLFRLDAKARKLLRELRAVVLMHEFNEYALDAA
jgi:hypothetical protein